MLINIAISNYNYDIVICYRKHDLKLSLEITGFDSHLIPLFRFISLLIQVDISDDVDIKS